MREKIRDLQRIEGVLSRLATVCSGEGSASDCLILETMQQEEAFEEAMS